MRNDNFILQIVTLGSSVVEVQTNGLLDTEEDSSIYQWIDRLRP